jgi:hypothetical protein
MKLTPLNRNRVAAAAENSTAIEVIGLALTVPARRRAQK